MSIRGLTKPSDSRARARLLVTAAALVVTADEAVYLTLVAERSSRVTLVFASLALAGSLPILAAVTEPHLRLFIFALCASTLAVWSFLGAFSIGVLILPAAVLLIVATARAASSVRPREATPLIAAAALIAVVVAVAGLSWTG
jgi:hypothetical protein